MNRKRSEGNCFCLGSFSDFKDYLFSSLRVPAAISSRFVPQLLHFSSSSYIGNPQQGHNTYCAGSGTFSFSSSKSDVPQLLHVVCSFGIRSPHFLQNTYFPSRGRLSSFRLFIPESSRFIFAGKHIAIISPIAPKRNPTQKPPLYPFDE